MLNVTPTDSRQGTGLFPIALFVASSMFFFLLLFARVWQTSVDVLFWDQWDFLVPFFDDRGLWWAFRMQFGPHRQGLGAIVIAASNAVSDWDMRILSAVTTTLLLPAMLIAARLKVVLYGRLTVWDAMIPPLFFRMGQADFLASIPNPSHGTLPVGIILLGCLIVTSESRVLQAALLAPFAFFAVHTGFANLLAPVLIGALAVRGFGELVARQWAEAAKTVVAIIGITLVSMTFLIGFHTMGLALACEDGVTPGAGDFANWVVVQSLNYWGLADLAISTIPAVLLLSALLGLTISSGRVASRDTPNASMQHWARHSVPLILISYSVIFSLTAAFGRICGGSGYALSSRYVTHMIPLGLGAYFTWLLLRDAAARSRVTTSAARVAGILLFGLAVWGGIFISSESRIRTEVEVHKKLMWAECVREGGGSVECTYRAHFMPHVSPEQLDERIEFLRERKLSFFSDDWTRENR